MTADHTTESAVGSQVDRGVRPEPARRCPDFDADCAHVRDPARCAAGAVVFHSRRGILETPPIDGFCPYLCGMLRHNDSLKGGA